MNEDLINAVCKAYKIGKCLTTPTLCSGGLLHRSWQFDTDNNQFIIKILNPAIINKPNKMARYRITESISRHFKNYVSVVCALIHQGEPLFQYKNQVIMLFPYVHGAILEQKKIKQQHVTHIGYALSQIHKTIKFNFSPQPDTCSLNFFAIEHKIDKLIVQYPEIVNDISNCKLVIKKICDHCQQYESVFKNNLVVSHRDCDPKNVLWDKNNNYYIIDWESAGLINKTKDTVVTAMYWSISNCNDYNINLTHLSAFLTAYKNNNGTIIKNEVEAALYGLLGDWLTWLDFNLARVLENPKDSNEFLIGKSEAMNTIAALPLILKQFSDIVPTIQSNF